MNKTVGKEQVQIQDEYLDRHGATLWWTDLCYYGQTVPSHLFL